MGQCGIYWLSLSTAIFKEWPVISLLLIKSCKLAETEIAMKHIVKRA